MKFRAGLIVGAAVGYVLGARAGRQRYEQIKRLTGEARKHPAIAQVVSQATGVTDLARNAVAGGLEVGSGRLRRVADAAE
ncbi:MAG: YtxH domain-containing protein [Acidimicrobiia bacterium]